MKELKVEARFGPVAGDPSTLSHAAAATLAALYRHPVAHNLEWRDVLALFERIGDVEPTSHDKVALVIGGERHVVQKRQSKTPTTSEIMELRHLLTRHGWVPQRVDLHTAAPASSNDKDATAPDLLVVVQHNEANVYHMALDAERPADDVVRPHDPHHLTHRDQERGQHVSEDEDFYKRIAEQLASAASIVVIGHGSGHSNAAHHLIEYLKHHDAEVYRKIKAVLPADIGALTRSELLVLGQQALTQET